VCAIPDPATHAILFNRLRLTADRSTQLNKQPNTTNTCHTKQAAEKAYAKIALAYDRFRKAGDLYGGYEKNVFVGDCLRTWAGDCDCVCM
jgi:hypothetical protein